MGGKDSGREINTHKLNREMAGQLDKMNVEKKNSGTNSERKMDKETDVMK